MSDTPAAPTTPEPYGVPETIAHWRRQAELCDSNVESATFLHCADEIEEVLALAEARSTPAEARCDRIEKALARLLRTNLQPGDAIHYPSAAWEAADALGILPSEPSDDYYETTCPVNPEPHRHIRVTEDNGPRFFR